MTTMTTRVPGLTSVNEVAELLKVCTTTIRRWIKRGDLHVHRAGHQLRIAEDDLLSFLNRNRI